MRLRDAEAVRDLLLGAYYTRYTRVTDFQTNVSDTRVAAALRTYLANIPLVTVKGVEADAVAAITRDLALRASVAYADGKYDSYPAGPCPIELIGNAATPCDLSGVGLPVCRNGPRQ